MSFGERVADRVAAFGGSWGFIAASVAAITAWLLINARTTKPFDPYPFILLNEDVRSVVAILRGLGGESP